MIDRDRRDFAEKMANASIEELTLDPTQYGLPTFQEFAANPDKWRTPVGELMGKIDEGATVLKHLKEHRYYFEGIAAKSLADVQRIAADFGVIVDNLSPNCVKIGLEKVSGGKFIAHCTFHREGWQPGEKGIHESVDGKH